MKKIVLVSAVLVASAFGVGASLATPPILIDFPPGFPGLGGSHGDAMNVGDAFNPFKKVADVQTACVEAGGTPIRQIEDNGTIGYRCYIPKQ